MAATDAQVRIAMSERKKGRTQVQAAAKANLRSRKTVAKYERSGRLPSQLKPLRTHRTRADPFVGDWPEVRLKLEAAPTLEATSLFDWLREERPGRYEPGQLRTFQRRVSEWRALNQNQVLTLEQVHEPGRVMQTDAIDLRELGITVQGQPLRHLLVHTVLPYSNWESGVVAQSESLIAYLRAFQTAVVKLQHVPLEHQVDNSTAATHKLCGNPQEAHLAESGRAFNDEFSDAMSHFKVRPRTTHLSSPDENGDVEGLNGALLRALEQKLLLRGSRDFEAEDELERWYQAIMDRRNVARDPRLQEELAVMRPLTAVPLPERRDYRVRVSRSGTINIRGNAYSVPSGLKGRQVTVQVYEWHVEVVYAGKVVQRMARQIGKGKHQVNYRHVIGTLLRKPGGFRGYRYRDQMFPTPTFREAWDQLNGRLSPRRADITYLRVLKLAADGQEADVDVALGIVMAEPSTWDDVTILGLVGTPSLAVPAVDCGAVDLEAYDRLLEAMDRDVDH